MVKSGQCKKALLTVGSEASALLLEIAWGCLVFMTEGMKGPYIAGLGREKYKAIFCAPEGKQKRRALRCLQQQKLIRIQEQGKRILITLTTAGKAALLREKIYNTADLLPDGQQCLVVFDFPLDARNARNAFRYFLKEVHFVRIQQSVWMTKYNVGAMLRVLVRMMDCEDWIRIYHARPLRG